jgi:hypothetical protein
LSSAERPAHFETFRLRLLIQPKPPNPASAVPNKGRAAGSGVAAVAGNEHGCPPTLYAGDGAADGGNTVQAEIRKHGRRVKAGCDGKGKIVWLW